MTGATSRLGYALAGLAVCLLAYCSLGVGATGVSLTALFSPTESEWTILTATRIPRLACILLAGAALSVAGLIMQHLTQNRFVSPSTSGTVEAAVLGILIATILGVSNVMGIMAIALVSSLLGTLGFLRMLDRLRTADPLAVAIMGLMYGAVLGALATFVAFQRNLIQLLETWTSGSFSQIVTGRFEPIFLVLAALVLGYVFADRFTVAGLGEDIASNLGLNYRRTLYIGLGVVSAMAAIVVVVVGAIPFLGLIVPNVVSIFMGDNLRRTLPVTALAGAVFVLVCDVIGRVIHMPYEIPVSTIAGVIGAAVFLYLIARAARRGAA